MILLYFNSVEIVSSNKIFRDNFKYLDNNIFSSHWFNFLFSAKVAARDRRLVCWSVCGHWSLSR